MGLQDYLSSGRLQLTCACRGELPPYGCWWGDGGEATREGCGIFGGRGGGAWEGEWGGMENAPPPLNAPHHLQLGGAVMDVHILSVSFPGPRAPQKSQSNE